MGDPTLPAWRRLLDFLAFGNVVVAGAAAALAAAASRAMELRPDPGVLLLAGGGTLAIYGLDRLRDLERDRPTAPQRAAFVERYRLAIAAMSALAGVAAAVAGVMSGPRCIAVAAGVAALGLAHRRLKRFRIAKPAYLILSWTAVAVALPLARDPAGQHVARVTGVVLFALWANVILSQLKDREGAVAIFGPRIARRGALLWSAVGTLVALGGPPPVARLAPLPLAMGVAVLGFRRSERYAVWGVDGVLLLGAIVALVLFAAGAR
jgi:4-hydroxybenzoate polyprenyltransferase